MLSVRKLFFSLSIVYCALLLASLLFARWMWFYPAELELQLEQQQHQLHSLTTILNLLSEQLQEQATSHANSLLPVLTDQDTQKTNKIAAAKRISNRLPNTIAIAFAANHEQQFIYATKRQQDTLIDIIDEPLLALLHNSLDQFITDPAQQPRFIELNQQLYIYALSPILNEAIVSSPSSSPSGWVGVLQPMTLDTWGAISDIARIQLAPIDMASLNNAATSFFTPLKTSKPQRQRCLFDVQQQPLQCFTLTHLQERPLNFLDQRSLLIFAAIIFFPIFLFSIFLSQVLRPLYKTMAILRDFEQKNLLKPITYSYWLPIKELKELKDIYNRVIAMALRQQQQLEFLSNTDKLTNIPNRRAFDSTFANTWNRLKRHSLSAALVMIDIDLFKPYNDFYGHQQGDNALQLVAAALANCARRTDEIAARYGGEEFVLIVFIENDYELKQFQQRLQQAISKLKIEHAKSTVAPHLTVSAGIAWIQNSGRWIENFLAEDWLKLADDALYQAKSAGRNKQKVTIINESQPFI